MDKLLFGTGGVPNSAKDSSTVAGIERIAELGLGAMELEFVQGVRMGRDSALSIGKLARDKSVILSAHAPYYINFNAKETEKVAASKERLLNAARIAHFCGAVSAIFHPAFYLNDPPAQVYDVVKRRLEAVTSELQRESNRVKLRPEVTGKKSQFGNLEEVIRLSSDVKGLAPCIDFAHWHARTGKNNSYPEFSAVLEQIKDKLGREALKDIHIHISGIAYSKLGEMRHLNLKESDFNYPDFIRALVDYKVKGLVIVESPSLEDDALLLKKTYESLTARVKSS